MFTEQELKHHSGEAENMDGIGKLLAMFQEEGVLPADGLLQPKDYDTAIGRIRNYKDVFLRLAKDEQEGESCFLSSSHIKIRRTELLITAIILKRRI